MAPAKYKKWLEKDNLIKLTGWARLGLTMDQIAHNMGIGRQTLYKWMNDYKDIKDALTKGREVVDFEVENALFNKAIGNVTSVDKVYKIQDVDSEVLKVRRIEYAEKLKEEQPELSDKQRTLLAVKNVPTYERILVSETVRKHPPDTGSLIFWLKNRMPELYRDQTFRKLNEAQTEKAIAEAKIAKDKAEQLETGTTENMIRIELYDSSEANEEAN